MNIQELMKVTTAEQIYLMCHAVGHDFSDNPRRNYFNAVELSKPWEDLVSNDLACFQDKGKQMGGIFYFLTPLGIEFLQTIIQT